MNEEEDEESMVVKQMSAQTNQLTIKKSKDWRGKLFMMFTQINMHKFQIEYKFFKYNLLIFS